ncbi:MAG: hypothetical protein IJZ39_09870 [Oscillospiraceae bacterium]|nr:hypothetical protein [Oscillospiraceae bacterium]
MEENGCLGAFFLGADILVVVFDLIAILMGKGTFGHYVSLLCAIVIAVCAFLQYREDHR